MSTHEMKVSELSEETTPTKSTNDDESISETIQTSDANHLILNGSLPSRKENQNNNEKCNKITPFSSEFVCE